MNLLFTVEYEELRAGQTAAGVTEMWFAAIEVFRSGLIDNPESRAETRCLALAKSPRHRNVSLTRWQNPEATSRYFHAERGVMAA